GAAVSADAAGSTEERELIRGIGRIEALRQRLARAAIVGGPEVPCSVRLVCRVRARVAAHHQRRGANRRNEPQQDGAEAARDAHDGVSLFAPPLRSNNDFMVSQTSANRSEDFASSGYDARRTLEGEANMGRVGSIAAALAFAVFCFAARDVRSDDKLPPAPASLKKAGTVDITEYEVGILAVDNVWGHGTVSALGQTKKFKLGGMGVGGAGGAKISATGNVYNLTDMNLFPG